MEHIKEIKEKLEAKRKEIQDRLDRIHVHRTHKNGTLDDDWKEQAVERQNDQVLDSLDNSTRYELNQIDSALAQIENDTYGVCVKCGTQIGEKRLIAIPFATTCIQCAV